VQVRCEDQGAADARLYFAVIDTGIGVPADKQPLIFKAFSQADGSTARQYGGTGLGLTISASLVEMMGGRLQVESHMGQGSRFYFSAGFGLGSAIPSAPAMKEESAVLAVNSSAEVPGRPLKILLVEDNAINHMLATRLLQKCGHFVTLATTGVEAVATLAAQSFDLVLLDVQMPGMDGFETTATIRARESELERHTPIIALTAHAIKGDRQRCLDAGMDGYVSKPINTRELLEEIRNLGLANTESHSTHPTAVPTHSSA
jgi:CheY-like chemotaxis protein